MAGDDRLLQMVGAGPAGMSVVLALCNRVAADEGVDSPARRILESLTVWEAADRPGGKMGHYRINANTSAHDVVLGIADDTPFVEVRDRYLHHPETQSRLIALPRIEALMVQPLATALRELLGDRLHCGSPVSVIRIENDGFSCHDGEDRLLARSRSLLLCCGAREVPLPELEPHVDRWEGSGRFLLRDDLDGLPEENGPIVIVGASHSAFSCAWRLLHDPLFAGFAENREIVVLKRRERIKLRCKPEFAALHRIEYDPASDVCPSTGIVFFSGGLRKDAKRLYLQIRDGEETRVRIVEMRSLAEQTDLLERAGLILQATGFVPNLPRIERDGVELEVGNPGQSGELHDLADGCIVPGLFGMGLGFNILPDDRSRGEASFDGGIHGFQSYPTSIAPRVIDRLVAHLGEERLN